MGAIVETSYGKVRGTEQGGVQVFRGIPFARPPLGALRFRPPQRPEAWTGVRDATVFGASASQNASALGPMLGFDIGETSEDCLFLNVWTPGVDGVRRPVLVWIHGGAFVMGSSSQTLYDGATLVRRGDVVVVTINYRLGAFGFLHLQELCGEALPSSGNAGIRDQIAALEWVRDNIAAFGGDPHKVTIFGESAGSISVATLLGTPRAQGLFHGAILQSGSANFVASRARASRVAEALLHELNIPPAEAHTLASVPADRILAAQQQVFLGQQSRGRPLPFVPVVDGDVLPRHPFDAVRDGLSKHVPMLIGTNLEEMKLFGLMDPQVRSLDEAGLVKRCERNISGCDATGVTHGRRAVETYRQVRAARGASTEPAELWFAIESDRSFRYPALRLAELQQAQQPQTYAYLFTWPSPLMDGILGSCHALDLPFVFGTFNDPMLGSFVGGGAAVGVLAERIQDAWIAFAHTGSPGHAGLGDWPAYDPERRATMLLDQECRVEHAPLEPERRFWEFWDGIIV